LNDLTPWITKDMVKNPNQHKEPIIRVVGSVSTGNGGRSYRKVLSWWWAFCVPLGITSFNAKK